MKLSDVEHVGFVGVGAMGLPMAQNLAKKLASNVKLHVFDISEKAVDKLVSAYPGKILKSANTLEVATKSSVIFTMLPEGEHVKSVYIDGPSSISASNPEGKLFLDCSTIDVASSLAVKNHLAKVTPSASFYDTPVSGGVLGAVSGALAFFVGSAEDDENAAFLSELLQLLGQSITFCGRPSLGLVAKLCNNYLLGIINIANAEAMNLGMQAGLDPNVLYRLLGKGAARNLLCEMNNPVPGVAPASASSKGYKAGFRMQLMAKDMSLALSMAQLNDTCLFLGEGSIDVYKRGLTDQKLKDLDFSAVFRLLGEKQNDADSKD